MVSLLHINFSTATSCPAIINVLDHRILQVMLFQNGRGFNLTLNALFLLERFQRVSQLRKTFTAQETPEIPINRQVHQFGGFPVLLKIVGHSCVNTDSHVIDKSSLMYFLVSKKVGPIFNDIDLPLIVH
jgi:hypothetical protein